MTFEISDHAVETAKSKGFTAEEIFEAMTKPERITDVTKYPGQKRFIAGRLAVVCEPSGEDHWIIRTMYLDGVLTPPRPDQTDAAGRRYARRYAAGQGRG